MKYKYFLYRFPESPNILIKTEGLGENEKEVDRGKRKKRKWPKNGLKTHFKGYKLKHFR